MTRGSEKVKAWRQACGLSQKAAAKRAEVSQGTWCDWEVGRKRPAIEQIVKLSTMTAASEHAITLHDFVETESDAAERQARRRKAS